MPELTVADVGIRFGGLVALSGVTFTVPERVLYSIIGPNGAGKSSLFNCISGLYKPSSGRVLFGDRDITRSLPHRIASLGISRTFQNLAFIRQMSVLDNVLLGAQAHHPFRPFASALRLPWEYRAEARLRAKALDLLAQASMEHLANERMAELTFGTQKRIELVRALMSDPTLILVDEPAGGLNGAEISELALVLQSIPRTQGASVILVEHNMGLVMSISERVIALDGGVKIAEGTPEEVAKDPVVVAAYLGGSV